MSRYVVCLVVASLLGTASVLPARAASDEGRVPVVTRLVQVFTGLEARLNEAIARGDRAALEPLVAEDFEQRAGREPGAPLPRAEWMAAVLADHPGSPSAIEQMAVHDQGDLALVSFLWHRRPAKPADPGLFVVDLWAKSGDAWQLKARYAALARGGAPGPAVPAPTSPPFKKKY